MVSVFTDGFCEPVGDEGAAVGAFLHGATARVRETFALNILQDAVAFQQSRVPGAPLGSPGITPAESGCQHEVEQVVFRSGGALWLRPRLQSCTYLGTVDISGVALGARTGVCYTVCALTIQRTCC